MLITEKGGEKLLLKLKQAKVGVTATLIIFLLLATLLYFWLNSKSVGSQVTNIGPGDLTSYLMGHWDTRLRRTTVFYVMNPTSKNLKVIFAFFDNEEKPLKAVIAKLSANDVVEVDARKYLAGGNWGVVKIFSVQAATDPKLLVLEDGIKGFQKELFLTVFKPSLPTYKYLYLAPPYRYSYIVNKRVRYYNMQGVIYPWPWTLTTALPAIKVVSATEANLKEIPNDVVDDAERRIIQGMINSTNVVIID